MEIFEKHESYKKMSDKWIKMFKKYSIEDEIYCLTQEKKMRLYSQ